MRVPIRPTATIACGALLAGCSAYSLAAPETPPVRVFGPSPRADLAVVCVIRPSHWALGVTFAVRDNGQLVGATRGESYFCYEAEPGEHAIVSSTGDSIDKDGDAKLSAVAGRRYWLHQDYANAFGVIVDKLAWVDEARAGELLQEGSCEYKTISGVPGNEALPGPLPIARAVAAR